MSAYFTSDFGGELQAVSTARRAVARFARRCGLSNTDVSDIEYSVGEALSNAAEHGAGNAGATGYCVFCRCETSSFTVEIQDGGGGFDPSLLRPKPPDARHRGFGILIMQQLMDHVEYSRNGTQIRLVKQRPLNK